MGNQKFGSPRRDLEKKAAFDIGWFDKKGEEQVATFYCFPGRLPGGLLFDVLRINDGSAPMWEFWGYVMDDATYKEFYRVVRKNPIDAQAIRDAMDWVIEYDTGYPTELPAT
jgi:hypothetical protein